MDLRVIWRAYADGGLEDRRGRRATTWSACRYYGPACRVPVPFSLTLAGPVRKGDETVMMKYGGGLSDRYRSIFSIACFAFPSWVSASASHSSRLGLPGSIIAALRRAAIVPSV